MSSYYKIVVFIFLILSFSSCANKSLNELEKKEYKINKNTKYYALEDMYIMFALEFENQKNYLDAIYIYKELYNNTNNYEYFLKYITLNFHLKKFKSILELIDENLLNDIKDLRQEEYILRIYSLSLLNNKELDKSYNVAKKLLDISKSDLNYELMGSVYLELKQYNNSYEMFEKSFNITKHPALLFTMTNIQYYYLFQKNQAKKSIENYLLMSGSYDYTLCLQLLSFYEKDKQEGKAINLLEKMMNYYESEKNQFFLDSSRKLYLRYLAIVDINKAIDFVKSNKLDKEILLKLYKISNNMKEALVLLEKMFEETNNLDYLAQIAIIEFEQANDKLKVLNSVIVKFEKVLDNLTSPVYENYLAYLLIDYDIDYEKALVLVKKALEKEPKNLAYLDTLAWGEYKIGNCTKAYEIMKRIVDEIGLDEEEIKVHWEKIKECK